MSERTLQKDLELMIKYRTINITDYIEEEHTQLYCEALMLMNQKDIKKQQKYPKWKPDPIFINIDTGGGSVVDAFGVIGYAKRCIAPIHTHCESKAYSMGIPLFLMGDKRTIGENATFMIHGIWSMYTGKLPKMADDLEYSYLLQSKIDNIITSETNITQKKLDKLYKKRKDWWFDANIAKELNFEK